MDFSHILLEKINILTANMTVEAILKHSTQSHICVVHFLYYANLKRYKKYEVYIRALTQSDFLLPDGIALRLLLARYRAGGITRFFLYRKNLLGDTPNLNGTDFIPHFLKIWEKSHGEEKYLFLFGGRKNILEKSKVIFRENFPTLRVVGQDGYSPYRFREMEHIRAKSPHAKFVLLVGLGTPKQELWIEENRSILKQLHVIVFSVGGLFDFIGGGEHRSPEWIRKNNLEWIYRAWTNPGKNGMKTLRSLLIFFDIFTFRK